MYYFCLFLGSLLSSVSDIQLACSIVGGVQTLAETFRMPPIYCEWSWFQRKWYARRTNSFNSFTILKVQGPFRKHLCTVLGFWCIAGFSQCLDSFKLIPNWNTRERSVSTAYCSSKYTSYGITAWHLLYFINVNVLKLERSIMKPIYIILRHNPLVAW